jgi:hypothetical protein
MNNAKVVLFLGIEQCALINGTLWESAPFNVFYLDDVIIMFSYWS